LSLVICFIFKWSRFHRSDRLFIILLLLLSCVHCQNIAPVTTSDTYDFIAEWSERGFLSVFNDKRGLFYWVFEAEFSYSEELKPPLVLWLSGPDGYGVSSIRDMFFKNGPYKIIDFPGPYGEDTLKMAQNPFKMNKYANIVWIDQPAGGGYSYSNTSAPVNSFEDAADDICEFLIKFFAKYPKFGASNLFLAGDGAAGTILLALADKLLMAKDRTLDTCPITLFTGIALNGPVVDVQFQWTGAVMTSTKYKIFSDDITDFLEKILEECLEYHKECAPLAPMLGGNPDSPKWNGCLLHFIQCERRLMNPSMSKADGRPFDKFNIINTDCEFDKKRTNSLCDQDFLIGLDRWLVEAEVLAAYGIPEFSTGFDMANSTVAYHLLASGARHQSYLPHLERALNAGIRVLLWTGKYDFYGNAFGLWELVKALTDFHDFGNSTLHEWSSSVRQEVHYRVKDSLTYAILEHAGHHMAFDFPRAAQGFLIDWMYGITELGIQEERETAQEVSVVVGVIVGVCLLGGFMVWFGFCPKGKLHSRSYAQPGHPSEREDSFDVETSINHSIYTTDPHSEAEQQSAVP